MSRPADPLADLATGLPAPTWVRWRVVGLLLAFSFLSWFNRVSMPVAYDERIKDQLGISEVAIGYVYSSLLFVYMLAMTPGGWFADRAGPRVALTVMGLGSAAFVALTGVVGMTGASAAGVVALLLVVRGMMGLFTAPIYPASTRAVAHWIPAPQRAGVNGAIMAAAVVGNAATFGGFGSLIDWLDWPAAFLVTGTITALVALVWTWYATDDPAQHPAVNEGELHWIRPIRQRAVSEAEADAIRAGEPPYRSAEGPSEAPGGWWVLLRNRSLVLLTLSYAAIGYFEYLFFFWMHYYFEKVLHVGKDESRLYATILNLAMAAGMLLGGLLADRMARTRGHRFGRRVVVVCGMLAGAWFLGQGVLAEEPGWIVLWFALALAAVGATEGPFWATAVELGGRRGATSAGIFNTGGNAGGVLAPVVTPLVSDAFGWPWGIGLGGLVCLAGACLWFWINPAEGEDRQG